MERRKVGKVLRPKGLKGEMKILPLTKSPDVFYDIKKLYADDKTYEVIKCSTDGVYVYLKLDSIPDINGAEDLRNKFLYADAGELPELGSDEYYIEDLIDCDVYDTQGELIGRVTDVKNYGASDILSIACGYEEIMCPFAGEAFVDVDIANRRITVDRVKFDEVTKYED